MLGVSVGGQLEEGSHDRRGGDESKSTVFGSCCTRQLLRVSACPVGSLLWVYSG